MGSTVLMGFWKNVFRIAVRRGPMRAEIEHALWMNRNETITAHGHSQDAWDVADVMGVLRELGMIR